MFAEWLRNWRLFTKGEEVALSCLRCCHDEEKVQISLSCDSVPFPVWLTVDSLLFKPFITSDWFLHMVLMDWDDCLLLVRDKRNVSAWVCFRLLVCKGQKVCPLRKINSFNWLAHRSWIGVSQTVRVWASLEQQMVLKRREHAGALRGFWMTITMGSAMGLGLRGGTGL